MSCALAWRQAMAQRVLHDRLKEKRRHAVLLTFGLYAVRDVQTIAEARALKVDVTRDEAEFARERRQLSRIVFNHIVAFIKLPLVFNNIVALMCSLLFLNGLVSASRRLSIMSSRSRKRERDLRRILIANESADSRKIFCREASASWG